MALGLRMWQDLLAEYLFGFAFGLAIFQALFMRDMVGGSYRRALRLSLLPEWVSMNAVMAGMVPVMVVLMSRDMRAMDPSSLRFWGTMSLAALVGFAVAYPLNVWLVVPGLKHGMGTVRALGEGGHSLEAEWVDSMPASSDVLRAGHASAADSHTASGGRRGATRPQIAAVTLLSVLALGAGLLVVALGGDLTMRREMPGHRAASASELPNAPPMHRMPMR